MQIVQRILLHLALFTYSAQALLPWSGPNTPSSRLGTSLLPQTDKSTPSAKFGRPIPEQMKQNNRRLVHNLKTFLFDTFFPTDTLHRHYARFYALETIARMPYFSYLSVLHLYETLGFWRQQEFIKTHFCETWNELHHLLIMEELLQNTQNTLFRDKFIAQHAAFAYYWIAIAIYMFNPTLAYNLNQAVEEEAYETYQQFLQTHAEYLQSQPAPLTAQQYYQQDSYLFQHMHHEPQNRNPVVCRTLYDCFVNIRDDEWEHVKTMEYCQQETASSNENE